MKGGEAEKIILNFIDYPKGQTTGNCGTQSYGSSLRKTKDDEGRRTKKNVPYPSDCKERSSLIPRKDRRAYRQRLFQLTVIKYQLSIRNNIFDH